MKTKEDSFGKFSIQFRFNSNGFRFRWDQRSGFSWTEMVDDAQASYWNANDRDHRGHGRFAAAYRGSYCRGASVQAAAQGEVTQQGFH